MLRRLFDGDRLAERVAGAYKEAHFQLEIEGAARTEGRREGVVGLRLPPGSAHVGAADDDGRRAAVVGDGKVKPVRLQRVVGAAHHDADVGGVLARRVEVGVIADFHGEEHFHIGHRNQGTLAKKMVVAQPGLILAQQVADRRASVAPGGRGPAT